MLGSQNILLLLNLFTHHKSADTKLLLQKELLARDETRKLDTKHDTERTIKNPFLKM